MSESTSPVSATSSPGAWLIWGRRGWALFEVLGVFIGGNLLARQIRRSLGVGTYKELLAAGPTGQPVDFYLLARVSAAELTIKFGTVLCLAFLVGWIHRRRPLSAYGLTTGGYRVGFLVRAGVVLFGLSLLPDLLLLLNEYVPLGEGAAHWWVLDEPWSPEFWLFMAASSFVLPPLFEEMLIRGYIQMRLVEDFGCVGGILLTATLFAASHGQYHNLSPLSLGMIASLFLGSVIWGYFFYRTGSLIPVIVAHVLVNIPVRGPGQFVQLAVMATIVLVAWKPILCYAREFIGEFSKGGE